VGISFLANAMRHPPPCGEGWGGGMGGRVPKSGAGVWEHPLLAPLGLTAKLRYLPHQGGGGGPVFGKAPRHSRIALMAFSPQISPPERFALRAGALLLFLSHSGRGLQAP
jgi:hypothetical protein